MAQLDIIGELQGKDLKHVLEEIYKQQDFDSVRQAESVTPIWKRAMKDGRIWKNTYYYQMKHFPKWNTFREILSVTANIRQLLSDNKYSSPLIYRQICFLIKQGIESLMPNWRNFNHHLSLTRLQDRRLGQVESFEFENNFSAVSPKFTDNYIVINNGIERNKLLIYNRWTRKLAKVLAIPVNEINWRGENPLTFYSYAVNENVIVSAFYARSLPWEVHMGFNLPTICVWDMKTYSLLQSIPADEMERFPCVAIFITEHDKHNGDRCQDCNCSNGGNILITSALQEDFCPEEMEFTARWLPNGCVKGQQVLLYRKTISPSAPGRALLCLETHVDENYIIALEQQGPNVTLIHVRRVCTFELVNTIEDVRGDGPRPINRISDILFDCCNELMVTAYSIIESPIRIWDITTGTLLSELPAEVDLMGIWLISNKFIFGFTNDQKGLLLGSLWDIPTAITNGTHATGPLESSKLWVKEVTPIEGKKMTTHNTSVYVDKFQVIVDFYEWGGTENYLSTSTFVTV